MIYSNSAIEPDVVNSLKALYTQNEAAQRFLAWAADRQNDSTQTSIDYLAQKAGIDRRGAIEIAKELERLGLGEFVVGRRGGKSRIVWSASLKSIGRTAIGSANSVETLDPELQDESRALDESGARSAEPLTIAEAKIRLAETFGVASDAIEITIRA